jgi:hypothetical protein
MKKVKLAVTRSKAIYIDDMRITYRSTKPWGGSDIIFEKVVPRNKVVATLVENGYSHLLKLIDPEEFTI